MELYRILREKRHQLHSLSIFIGLWAWWEWPSWPRDRIIPENENDTTFTSEMCGREHFGIGVGHPSASWKYNIVCVGRICQRICRNQSISVRTYLLTANLTANEAWYLINLISNKGVAPYYVINNTTLEEVNEIKDLGVYYDSLLLFDKHIIEKVKKPTWCWG